MTHRDGSANLDSAFQKAGDVTEQKIVRTGQMKSPVVGNCIMQNLGHHCLLLWNYVCD